MHLFFIWRYLLLGLFFTFSLFGGTLEVGERECYWVLPYCEYAPVDNIKDTPHDLSPDIWIKDKTDLKLNRLNGGFWIKVKIKNQDNLKKELFLISKRNYIYSMEYYLFNKENVLLNHIEAESQLREDKESYNGLHRIIPIILKENEEVEIFFKVQSFNVGTVSFNMVSRDYLTKFYQDYSFFKGIYFGIILIMILYNIVLYFFFKFRSYLYYVLYLSSYFLYSIAYTGYFYHYTNLSQVSINILMSVGYVGFLIFISAFVQELFSSKKENVLLIRWIGYIQIYLLLILVIKIVFIYYDSFFYIELFTNFQNIILPFYYILILYFLYEIAYKKNKNKSKANSLGLWYFSSWAIIGVIGFLQVAAFQNFLSMERGFDHIFEACMALESLLFSILLSLRIREIKREKDEKDRLLVQQNRLASMGEMIVSIAHQWRQPLAEINGVVMNLDLDYQNKNLPNDRLQKHLLDIENTTQHLSETMNDFMDFFNHKKELNHFFISELFEHSIKLVQMSSREKVEILYDVDSKIEIAGYRSELVQVLLILINNAIDAFVTNETKSPKIEMSAIKKEDYIHFKIEDNGGGIPLSIIEKIYEPYFTSKPKTQGTGLGLYILKIIIEKSMLGEVSLENSEKGVVCNFKILNFISSEKMLI